MANPAITSLYAKATRTGRAEHAPLFSAQGEKLWLGQWLLAEMS